MLYKWQAAVKMAADNCFEVSAFTHSPVRNNAKRKE
jgi:hypothetical protein